MAEITPEWVDDVADALELSESSNNKQGEEFRGQCSHTLIAAIALLFSTLSGQYNDFQFIQCVYPMGNKGRTYSKLGKDEF